jgi:hypothetical protein
MEKINKENVDLEALYQDAHTDFTDLNKSILLMILAELKGIRSDMKQINERMRIRK